MLPTFIYNSPYSEYDVFQYLANSGILNTLRRNPYDKAPPIEEEGLPERKERAILLDFMLMQARALGWDDSTTPGISTWKMSANEKNFKKLPEVLQCLTKGEILKLIQNQAKLLLKIAPRSECQKRVMVIDEKGKTKYITRTVIIPMVIYEEAGGNLWWRIPDQYQFIPAKGSQKSSRRYYVYDAAGARQVVETEKRGNRYYPKCTLLGNHKDADKYGRVPLKKSSLKKTFLSSRYGWPVPFLPKQWFEPPRQEENEERKLTAWERWHEDLISIFPAGFLKILEPKPVEVVATEKPPALEEVGPLPDISPDTLARTMPDNSDPPAPLDLPENAGPFDWQRAAFQRWVNNKETKQIGDDKKKILRAWTGGIVEACTGAGKTRFSFLTIDHVLKKYGPKVRITIVVPKKVLIDQWYDEINERYGTKVGGISRHSGDHKDTQVGQISIWVINTAAKKLPVLDMLYPYLTNQYPKHLLIVDEVHRSVSRSFRKIYDFSGSGWESSNFLAPEYRLGLTATLPGSGIRQKVSKRKQKNDDAEIKAKKFQLLVRQLGKVVAQYKYAEALKYGTISQFILHFRHTQLTLEEQVAYDSISDSITKLSHKIERERARGTLLPRGYEDFTKEEISRLPSDEREDMGAPDLVRGIKFLGAARAILNWNATNRLACAVDLIRQKVAEGRKIIVFHKSIDGATALFNLLVKGIGIDGPFEPIPAGLYHSNISKTVNEDFLEAFKNKGKGPKINVLVSVQSLLEGLNVPETDVGIAVAADKSQIKAVQSLGRVLRRTADPRPKEYHLIVVRIAGGEDRELGDTIIKSMFLNALRDRDGNIVLNHPVQDNDECFAEPPGAAATDALFRESGLVSYQQIQGLCEAVTNDPTVLTRAKMKKKMRQSLQDHFGEESYWTTDRWRGDDLIDAFTMDEIQDLIQGKHIEPFWPSWIVDKHPQLRIQLEPEDKPKGPWR